MRILVMAAYLFCGMAATISAQSQVLRLSLEDAMQMALEWSPELRSLAVQSKAAYSAYTLGIREFFPKVNLDFGQVNSIIIDAPDNRTTKLGVTATQLVYDAGRLARKRDLSRLQLRINAVSNSEKSLDLRDQVRQLWWRLLQDQEKFRIQESAIALSSSQLAIAQKELSLGMSREIDVAETQAALDNLLLEKAGSELAMEQSRQAMASILGLESENSFEMIGGIDTSYAGLALKVDLAFATALAEGHSQEIAAQEFQIRSKALELQSASTWYLPDISLETSLSFSGSRFPLQTPNLSAKLSFSFPVKSFPVSQSIALGQVSTNEKDSSSSTSIGILSDLSAATEESAAKALLGIERIKNQAMRRELGQKVAQAITSQRLSVRRIALQRQSIASQEIKNRIMAKQLELGEVKRIDYLTAETQLAQSRMALVDQVVQLMVAERALERLLGLEEGGLKALAGGSIKQ